MRERVNEFYSKIRQLDYEKHLKYYLKYQLAPVIMGFKPSATLAITRYKGIGCQWDLYSDKVLEELGLQAISLRESNGTIVMLFYKTCLIQEVLDNKENKIFLKTIGYNVESVHSSIQNLAQRYTEVHCPHELGVFLGIPLNDVKDFANNTQKQCLACGYWKVYNNLQEAECIFRNYDRAKHKILTEVLKELEEAS